MEKHQQIMGIKRHEASIGYNEPRIREEFFTEQQLKT